jgi:hypothetical protein
MAGGCEIITPVRGDNDIVARMRAHNIRGE